MDRATAEPFIRFCSTLTFRGDNGDDELCPYVGVGSQEVMTDEKI
jgi:hypothetical protein